MTAGAWVRAARRTRRLSQRELAERAEVPVSTIGRIEAERTTPRIDTFVKLIASIGYEVVLVDQQLRMLRLDPAHDRLRDRGARRFPAHLRFDRTPSYDEGGWWGWERIAWPSHGEYVPEFTYWRRRPAPRTVGDPAASWSVDHLLWDDAT
jgi:transcriptional regulator with XRE-family HTH domain